MVDIHVHYIVCIEREIPWASHDCGTLYTLHTHVMGMWKRRKKSDRCRFFAFCILLLNAYNYFEYLLETYKAAHEREMLLLFFQKLTMYTVCTTSRYMRWWFNRLFDDNAKNVYVSAWHSIEYLHSCYFCIFLFIASFVFAQAAWGLIYGLKVALYSRWPCDGE